MKALTIKQPWAWAIVAGFKDVENRTWRTDYRGPLLVHAGGRYDASAEARIRALGLEIPDELALGGVIGRVDVVGCVRNSRSPWAIAGYWHWLLRDPRPLPFRARRGQQGLFEIGTRAQQSLGF